MKRLYHYFFVVVVFFCYTSFEEYNRSSVKRKNVMRKRSVFCDEKERKRKLLTNTPCLRAYAYSSENLSIRFSALSLFLLVCFASYCFSPDTDFVVFSMLAIISLQVPFGGTNAFVES